MKGDFRRVNLTLKLQVMLQKAEARKNKSAFNLMDFSFRLKALDATLTLALHFSESPFLQKGPVIW